MRYLGILILIHTALLPCLETPVYPMDVTLQWDGDSQVDGYHLHYKSGSSGPPYNGTGAAEGDSPIHVGYVTELTLRALSDDEDYYFAVTAYKDDLQSGYSNEARMLSNSADQSQTALDGREVGCFISTAGCGSHVEVGIAVSTLLLGSSLSGLMGLRSKFKK